MSDYSKEYLDKEGVNNSDYDFYYLEEFRNLKEGESYNQICEGLGTYGIAKKENAPYLIIKDADSNLLLVEYFTYLH